MLHNKRITCKNLLIHNVGPGNKTQGSGSGSEGSTLIICNSAFIDYDTFCGFAVVTRSAYIGLPGINIYANTRLNLLPSF